MNDTSLKARLGGIDIDALSEEKIRPLLEEFSQSAAPGDQKALISSLSRSFTIGFFGFFFGFSVFVVVFPDTWWGTVLKFILFPVLFFGVMALVAWLRRDEIMKLLLRAEGAFLARSSALDEIAQALGLTYVPAPGGAPEALKVLMNIPVVPRKLNHLIELLDRHGGQDEAVKLATESGLLNPDVVVLGGKEDKARYYRQTAMGNAFEDGFEGARNGVSFSAFEWVESVEDEPDRYHLLLVLTAPYRLHGATQLRSRKTSWPHALEDGGTFSPVDLLPPTFNEYFRLRSTDQTEARTIFNPAVVERVLAMAHGNPFRAVARAGHIVIDLVGDNRFNRVELSSGEWSEETIRQTLTDIAELLELVDVMAHAFMVDE